METTTIRITNMSCGGCVRSVIGALQALPGVRKVDVSLEKGEARIEHDAGVTREAMKRAVEDAGFEAA